MLTAAHAAWQPEEVVAPCAPARRSSMRSSMRACCGLACAAFKARKRHAARRRSTAGARQRSCHEIARPLPSALMPLVEVVVVLAAAHDVAVSAAPARAVPYGARRARPRHCGVDMSACMCKNVHVSCMCIAVELCVGVCIVGAHVRVLALARVCVLRRGCRASLLTPETVRPFPSCGTTGRCREREAHRHGALFTEFFFRCTPYTNNEISRVALNSVFLP